MTNEEKRDILLNSLVYPNCPHFWESKEFPISSKIGEGHKFTIESGELITKADRDRKTGKRKIFAEITSYRGMCAGARHYYCKINSYIRNVSESGYVYGYLDRYKIPQEFTSIKVELGRRVTAQMIEEDELRWENYDPGDMTNAFETKEDIPDVLAVHNFGCIGENVLMFSSSDKASILDIPLKYSFASSNFSSCHTIHSILFLHKLPFEQLSCIHLQVLSKPHNHQL